MQTYTKRDHTIPALGFGTWQLKNQAAARMVEAALDIGYRHIDTAQAYENEAWVGNGLAQGLASAGLSRNDVWLTTKVWTDQFQNGDLQDSVDASLDKLGTDYVDLLLLHWPNPDVPLEETLDALNAVQADGRAKTIGVSNFPTALIEAATQLSAAPLLTNQVEYHPFLDQSAVMQSLQAHDMLLTAYSPTAQGEVFSHDLLNGMGAAHGKNGGQVTLRWLLQQRVVAIPRTSDEEHAASNFDIFDFELSAEEMRKIHDLARPDGRIIDPSFAPEWD